MKKLVRKLALSCFALGACALTLASTTYAWWTTNTEVSANEVTGTASTSGAASIFISSDLDVWAQSVSLKAQLDESKSGTDMIPLELRADGKLYEYGATTATTSDKKFLQFKLYFKTAKTTAPVTIYFDDITVSNTNTLKTFDNLLYKNNNFSLQEVGVDPDLHQTYSANIVNALAMTTTSTAKTVGETAYPSIYNKFDLQSFVTSDSLKGTVETEACAFA